MTDTTIDLERERIACVFGLGGGELHEAHAEFPDEWDGVIAYWYDGPPEYATELKEANIVECSTCGGIGYDAERDADCRICDGVGHDDREVRTAILECLYGEPEPPDGWERIASYSSSGEASCWWCGDGSGNEDERATCKLCEGDGLVYLGDGWAEMVFRRVESED